MTERLFRAVVAGLFLAMAGCTVVKPVVGAFAHPIRVIAHDLEDDDEEEDQEEYADIPPPLLLAGAPVLIPVRFVGLSAVGVLGGLLSGIASDFNVVVWNFDDPVANVTHPFKTNAARPEEE